MTDHLGDAKVNSPRKSPKSPSSARRRNDKTEFKQSAYIVQSSTDAACNQIILNSFGEDLVKNGWRVGDIMTLCPVAEESKSTSIIPKIVGRLKISRNVPAGALHVHPDRLWSLELRVGAKVQLDRFGGAISEAGQVVLANDGSSVRQLDESDILHATEQLVELGIITKGLAVTVNLRGRRRVLRVEQITAYGPDESTKVFRVSRRTIVKTGPSERKITQSVEPVASQLAIGGLQSEMELIRRLAEASLVNGNDLKHFGVRPSRGLLLHGPPGTGKTMITRTIASAMRVPVLTINGPEIISKFVGETETKLRDLFQRARDNAPCIIFVDELDALCSTRTSATELENRIVATFLTLMDGLSEDGSHDSASIFVIGATNRPNSIDAALRRPGRFDREVLIGVPTPSARLDILKILLQDVPNSLSDAQLLQLASSTHGFVGADLAALCREAGLNTIQRCRQTSEQESSIMITMEDMLKSQLGIRPSAMREILLEVPKVRWSDIGGQADVKQKLKEAIEWPLKHPEAFERFGIRPPKGILLYGPPGCSKTLMAKAMATESGLNFMAVKGPELFSKWVGESERAVKEIFRRARAASPSIIFFDEIDAIAVRRGSGDASVGDRVLSQLLAEMDGIEQLTNVTIVAATNRPDILDSALLRPGRIDRILYIAPPDAASRLQILEMRLKVMACAENINLAQLVDWSDGFSGAECVSFCNEAAFKAMEECFDNPKVAMQHFEHARSTVQPQIGAEMLAFYKAFQERSGLRSV